MTLASKNILFVICALISLSCWNNFLFSMEAEDFPVIEGDKEENKNSEENNASSSQATERLFNVSVGGQVFELSSDNIKEIKALDDMINDTLGEQESEERESIEIDGLFSDPSAHEENQRNFEKILGYLGEIREENNLGLGYGPRLAQHYAIENWVEILNYSNKLNVQAVLNKGIKFLADYIDDQKEIDDQLLLQLEQLIPDIFLQICERLKFVKPVLVDKFSLNLNRRDPNTIESVAFNNDRNKIAFCHGSKIYIIDLIKKIITPLLDCEAYRLTFAHNSLHGEILIIQTQEAISYWSFKENKELEKKELKDSIKNDNKLFPELLSDFVDLVNENGANKLKELYILEGRSKSCRKGFKTDVKIWARVENDEDIGVYQHGQRIACLRQNFSNCQFITMFRFHPTKPLLYFNVCDLSNNRNFVCKGNVKTNEVDLIFTQICSPLSIECNSDGSRLFCMDYKRKNLWNINMATKERDTFSLRLGPGKRFVLSNDDSLMAIGQSDSVLLYKFSSAITKHLSTPEELRLLCRLEKSRVNNEKLSLCSHINPNLYETYKSTNAFEDLAQFVNSGCTWNCYWNTLKEKIKKRPIVTAGIVGTTLATGYFLYKKFKKA